VVLVSWDSSTRIATTATFSPRTNGVDIIARRDLSNIVGVSSSVDVIATDAGPVVIESQADRRWLIPASGPPRRIAVPESVRIGSAGVSALFSSPDDTITVSEGSIRREYRDQLDRRVAILVAPAGQTPLVDVWPVKTSTSLVDLRSNTVVLKDVSLRVQGSTIGSPEQSQASLPDALSSLARWDLIHSRPDWIMLLDHRDARVALLDGFGARTDLATIITGPTSPELLVGVPYSRFVLVLAVPEIQ